MKFTLVIWSFFSLGVDTKFVSFGHQLRIWNEAISNYSLLPENSKRQRLTRKSNIPSLPLLGLQWTVFWHNWNLITSSEQPKIVKGCLQPSRHKKSIVQIVFICKCSGPLSFPISKCFFVVDPRFFIVFFLQWISNRL